MSTAKQITEYIQQLPPGEMFTNAELMKYGSRVNVDQILSRLVKAKKLTRVARGFFAKPKISRYVGEVLPEPGEIAATIARNSGEVIVPHGAEAARQLQLSTQVPAKPIFLTSGTTRHIKIGATEIVLKHVSPRKIVKPGTIAGLVISALWYLGKKQTSAKTIDQVKSKLSPNEFQEVLANVPSMPNWMADVFYYYQKEHHYADHTSIRQ